MQVSAERASELGVVICLRAVYCYGSKEKETDLSCVIESLTVWQHYMYEHGREASRQWRSAAWRSSGTRAKKIITDVVCEPK